MVDAMTEQICPICGATNTSEARTCVLCDARLPGRSTTSVKLQGVREVAPSFYDSMLGEDDLMVKSAPGGIWLAGLFLLIGTALGAGLVYGITTFLGDDDGVTTESVGTNTPIVSPADNGFVTLSPAATFAPTFIPTNTRIVPDLPTVTPQATFTPTQGPCVFTVQAEDTLYGLALRCGHVDFSAVDAIVEYNSLSCPTCIQAGQVIEVPRPTPTVDPALIEENSSSSSSEVVTVADTNVVTVSADDIVQTRAVALEPTLDPGLMWHTVIQNQTLYDIIAIYNIDAKLLSEINPEIDFPQCDFGERYGGPTCAVFLAEGQQIRVPAPTPTPTIPPTLSGSETPTPTATATFNVPALFSPGEGEQFDASRIVTLRWTSSGTLGLDEAYLVRVTNIKTGELHTALSCDLSFDLPMGWQPDKKESQEYNWSVSVVLMRPGVNTDGTTYAVRRLNWALCQLSTDFEVTWDTRGVGSIAEVVALNERYPTAPRRFFWQGK